MSDRAVHYRKSAAGLVKELQHFQNSEIKLNDHACSHAPYRPHTTTRPRVGYEVDEGLAQQILERLQPRGDGGEKLQGAPPMAPPREESVKPSTL